MAQSTYTQYYSNFIGADMSSDARVVARNRLAHSVNMWRDYESEQGAAVETFPGFRRCAYIGYFPYDGDLKPYGNRNMWFLKAKKHQYLIVNHSPKLMAYRIDELKNSQEIIIDNVETEYPHQVFDSEKLGLSEEMEGFVANSTLFLIGNGRMVRVWERESEFEDSLIYGIVAEKVSNFYIPTTYYNGKPYEQRNALTSYVKERHKGVLPEEECTYDTGNPGGTTATFKVFRPNEKYKSVIVEDGLKNLTKGQTLQDVDPGNDGHADYFIWTGEGTDGGTTIEAIYFRRTLASVDITIKGEASDVHFNTIGDLVRFQDDKVTMAEAILGCTKSAVYDGRVFLTGNPTIPNTVFYSHRNLTGVNDPTYFGVYNYFNDGEGNTPNVDMLAMPNMLMVIKRDTTQDGSIYYHVGADNPHSDESVRNLVPRIYPSSTGAAGLGSAGLTDAYSLSCNFLDDPVFLSRRGLEGITKEQLNAERTVQHRSSTIDRLLIQEDLAHASLAEWKGYLVVCCNGHIYLADSRTKTQNAYGSFQYEWFYLEGVGTYDKYWPAYKKMTSYPDVEGFAEACEKSGIKLWEKDDGEVLFDSGVISESINEITVYYYKDDNGKRLLDITDQCVGQGFHGAKRVLAVGELLFFATDHDICVFNTDKRGEQIYLKDDDGNYVYDEKGKKIIFREVDSDKIDSSWYTFDGVPYISGCSIRLDDCEKKTVTKANVYGTTVARFKMIPGSRCKIKSSINGRDWKKIGEGHASRFDFGDFRFDNTSFTENEDSVYVLPEVSRGWVSKQYYFYSDGFCEPFGLYELSYNYKIVGKIRR